MRSVLLLRQILPLLGQAEDIDRVDLTGNFVGHDGGVGRDRENDCKNECRQGDDRHYLHAHPTSSSCSVDRPAMRPYFAPVLSGCRSVTGLVSKVLRRALGAGIMPTKRQVSPRVLQRWPVDEE